MSRTMIIEPGKASYEILKYIQNNPDKVKKISAHRLAELVAAQDDNPYGEVTLAQVISKLVKKRVIYRSDADKYYDFRINYWHELIPEDILANAPVEVKRLMAKKIDDMEPGQYMDEEGCIVTPNAVPIATDDDPFYEDDDTDFTIEDGEEIVEEYDDMEDVEEDEEKKPKQEEHTPIEPYVTAQEFYAQQYFNNLAKEERFKGIAKEIKSGEILHELSKYGISIFDENGEINDGVIKAFLSVFAKDKKGKPEETTNDIGSTTIPLHITKEKDGKTTNVTINLTINI